MADPMKVDQQSWCPVCRGGPAGPDCPDVAVDKRAAHKRERKRWRRLTADAH